MTDVDFLVIGAGIAGASVAWWLAPHGRTLVLEREDQPGYHSTGRSAALFSETYGPAQVRALSRASRDFLMHPPAGFCDQPVLSPRGTLIVGRPGQDEALAALHRELAAQGTVHWWRPEQALAAVSVLRPQRTGFAIHEPGSCDIDVHGLHQGFLRGLRRAGGDLQCRAEVTGISREGEGWRVQVADGRQWRARRVLNAAGAWADRIGMLAGLAPIGLQPCRRSAFVFAPPPGLDCAAWPMVTDLDESWYFKPDSGQLLASPANADPVPPQDVQAEELDIALAIDRLEQATTLTIRRPARVWAGLRSFVADGELVAGARADAPGFLWVAAQGGYGIQTCAAMGQLCAALALGRPVPEALLAHGVQAAALSPAREGIG
ncbi:MAG: FAD-binding oxidoreductase [Betaproteobacteria bacterium]|nr:FAD-binding oxidoreductase [Betaproteobacteria bacterium]